LVDNRWIEGAGALRGGLIEMQDPRAAAPLAVRALQQWYGADPYAQDKGLYSYHDPARDTHWADWRSFSQISRNVVNTAIALTGQRNRMQDTARWWNSANAITAVIGFMSVTGDRSYLQSVVENTFAKAPGVRRPVNRVSLTALRRPAYPGFINGFYDDEGWWALAWIDAYDLTGEERYLAAAEDIFLDMADGWDDVWHGGIYWGKYNGQPDRAGVAAVPAGWHGPYKNAIANELFISVAAGLALRKRRSNPGGDDHAGCLQWAQRGWAWFSSPAPGGVAMINAAGLVNDSPNSSGVNSNTATVWSYNQGVLLRGLSDLTELTGDPAYRARAEEIADAFIRNPWHQAPRPAPGQAPQPPPTQSGVIHGILHEHDDCKADGSSRLPAMPGVDSTLFKGIFVRNLARLYQATGKPGYREFILANAGSALGYVNENHQFGCNWAAPVDATDFVRQTAGVDLINAALLVSSGTGAGTGAAAGTAQAPGATHAPGTGQTSEAAQPATAGNSGVKGMANQLAPGAAKPGLPPGAVKPGWTTTEFWQTLIVHLIAAIVALGTVFHTHFNLNGLQAVVPSVAVVASALAQSVYSHSRATVKSSAQAAGANAAGHQAARPAGLGAAPIVVQLTGIQPVHSDGPVSAA
jgi:predicted alpha-1,6-mannanase (GH76 family)